MMQKGVTLSEWWTKSEAPKPPSEKYTLSLANPGCITCKGLGVVEVIQNKQMIICHCRNLIAKQ